MTTVAEAHEIFVARQPIFDDRNHVHGYELLYRSAPDADSADGEQAVMGPSVMIDALLGMGLSEVTGGRPAFVNVNRAMLANGAVELFDPEQVVLEILESVRPDPEVVQTVEELARRGYRFALDDFTYTPEIEPLLILASVVKVDMLEHDDAGLRETVARVRPFGAALLAEKVEDQAAHERALELGFRYFQGYYFSQPQMIHTADLGVERLNIMRLLNVVNDPETSDSALEHIFRGDVSLSYKLLRMVNSAAMGGRGISSISHALQLLGRKALYRWLALMLASGGAATGPRGEMVHSALLRAGMAERLARETGHTSEAPALYLAGLFSRLDALMNTPMDELLDRLDLRPELHQALAGRRGPLGPTLALVEAYEDGRWSDMPELMKQARAAGVDLAPLYLDALQEADRYLQALSAVGSEEEEEERMAG